MTNPGRSNEARSNGAFYQFDDFSVDCANFRLYKASKPRTLPPRAFDLLICLIENCDRVVEKQELFERVWNESFVTDNALTRAIKEIRSELDDDAAAPRYIKTVHKRGYRFIGEINNSLPETPQGPQNTGQQIDVGAQIIETRDAPLRPSNKIRAAVGIIALALVVSAATLFYFGRNDRQIRVLAVLPLENSTGNPEDEYMSDGITESLINSLSRLPQIKVIPRAIAFRYKRKEIDARQLGRELGIDAVVTGRITQQGNDLVVQTEITNTSDGSQFWGDRFSRKLSDIFLLQEEIAKVISDKLELKLSGEEKKWLAKRYTENAKAYEFYLKGRYHLDKLTRTEVQASITCFQQAIDLDAAYAMAYVGLGEAFRALSLSTDLPGPEFFPKSKAAAQKAVELDPTLAEAHAVLGFANQFYDWDWQAAEDEYKKALELDPNNAETHISYSGLFAILGRYAEALNEIRRARELDPLNLRTSVLEGRMLVLAGRTDEGLAKLQNAMELEPKFFLSHLFMSIAYIKKGMYDDAIIEATKAKDLSGGNAEAIGTIGYALAMSGRRDEARSIIVELQKRSNEGFVPPYDFAMVYNGLGERDEMFAWLQRGIQQRDPKMLFLTGSEQWENIRDDPRYLELLKQMNLTK